MGAIKITAENFEKEVLKSEKPVLLDFWAEWCGPCKMIGPVIEEIAEETKEYAKVGKVNVDEERFLSDKFNVMSIPTLILFKDGKVVSTSIGAKPKKEILEMLK